MPTTYVECPECGHGWDEDLGSHSLDVQEATDAILNYYKGGEASLGDAQTLAETIKTCLVDKLGVSSGKI